MRFATFALAFALFATPISLCYAYDIPANDGLVTIATNADTVVLTQAERDALASTLAEYDRATSNQIAIVIVQSLGGETIEDVGLQIARKWEVGSRKNNGILILFSYDDRQVRIDVGYGLEGVVPDVVAHGIIEEEMIPRFRVGDYNGGFVAAIDALKKHIGGEYTSDRYASKNDGSPAWSFAIFGIFIVIQWVLAILARTKSWWLGGVFGAIAGVILVVIFGWWLAIPLLTVAGLILDFVVSAAYRRRGRTAWWAGGGWGPGGSGGGSSGGFGGFGGGSFGGGGASGRW